MYHVKGGFVFIHKNKQNNRKKNTNLFDEKIDIVQIQHVHAYFDLNFADYYNKYNNPVYNIYDILVMKAQKRIGLDQQFIRVMEELHIFIIKSCMFINNDQTKPLVRNQCTNCSIHTKQLFQVLRHMLHFFFFFSSTC